MKSDDIRTYLWAGICLTGFCFVFINGNAEEGGRIFWHLLKAHDQAAAGWMAGILIVALLLAGYDRLARFPVAGFLDLLERRRYLGRLPVVDRPLDRHAGCLQEPSPSNG
jgi:hypothetical protein